LKRNSEGTSKEKDNKVNYDWEKMIHDSKKDINENIANVKLKAESLQKQAERKAQLLKYTNTEHTELGDEVGDLYINSIQAKLQIVNAMTNPNNDNKGDDYSDVEED
jgi:sortase (surface protein transpeptidase)